MKDYSPACVFCQWPKWVLKANARQPNSHGVPVTWGWGRRRRRPAASASAWSGRADRPASEPAWWRAGTSSCCHAGFQFEPPAPCPPSWSPDPTSLTESAWCTAEEREFLTMWPSHTHTSWTIINMRTEKGRTQIITFFFFFFKGRQGYFISVDAPLSHKVQFFHGWIL